VKDFVNRSTYKNIFKEELLKKCIIYNSEGEFNNNIKNDLYINLPPPPPFYIKQAYPSMDTLVRNAQIHSNIILNCYKLLNTYEVNTTIKSEYSQKLKNENLE